MSQRIITMVCGEDQHFNHEAHVLRFLEHLFIANRRSVTGFFLIEGGFCVNGKCFLIEGLESIKDRQKACDIAFSNEIDFKNDICKTFLVTFKNGSYPDNEDFEEFCETVKDVVDKNNNITYFCVSYHPRQRERYPHYHVFYTSKVDIPDELENEIIKYLNS